MHSPCWWKFNSIIQASERAASAAPPPLISNPNTRRLRGNLKSTPVAQERVCALAWFYYTSRPPHIKPRNETRTRVTAMNFTSMCYAATDIHIVLRRPNAKKLHESYKFNGTASSVLTFCLKYLVCHKNIAWHTINFRNKVRTDDREYPTFDKSFISKLRNEKYFSHFACMHGMHSNLMERIPSNLIFVFKSIK